VSKSDNERWDEMKNSFIDGNKDWDECRMEFLRHLAEVRREAAEGEWRRCMGVLKERECWISNDALRANPPHPAAAVTEGVHLCQKCGDTGTVSKFMDHSQPGCSVISYPCDCPNGVYALGRNNPSDVTEGDRRANGCCRECEWCAMQSGTPRLCDECLQRRRECAARHREDPAEEYTGVVVVNWAG
jgi:hypothetical protein